MSTAPLNQILFHQLMDHILVIKLTSSLMFIQRNNFPNPVNRVGRVKSAQQFTLLTHVSATITHITSLREQQSASG